MGKRNIQINLFRKKATITWFGTKYYRQATIDYDKSMRISELIEIAQKKAKKFRYE